METFAPASTFQHTRIRINTEHPLQFIDFTANVEAVLAGWRADSGLINIQSLHTTTAIVLNEHEPLLLEDFGALFERTASSSLAYQHDDARIRTVNLTPQERVNGHAHCRALLLGASACLNVADGRLQLGRWQRLFLVELDGPQPRDVSVLFLGETLR